MAGGNAKTYNTIRTKLHAKTIFVFTICQKYIDIFGGVFFFVVLFRVKWKSHSVDKPI